MNTYNKFTFFWNGPFSQWHPSPFNINGIRYNCAEQYMMFHKAWFFGDKEMMNKIIYSSDPSFQKSCGRNVKNFNADKWNEIAKEVVLRGSVAKFTQNTYLLDYLLDTKDTLIVEASPEDRIWGIGLDENTAKLTLPSEWPGSNWLGLILTSVRDNILNSLSELKTFK